MAADKPTSIHVVKNGLSALLMRAIWEESGEDWFYYHFDGVDEHRADVEAVLAPLGYKARRLDDRLASPMSRHVLRQKPAALYYTHSVGTLTRQFLRRARTAMKEIPEYVVQHGTVELIAYIDAVRGRKRETAAAYYVLFERELSRFLRNAKQPIELRSYPPIPVEPVSRNPGPVRRSLFAVNRMLEDNVLPEAAVRRLAESFLERRPPTHYVLKPHPRGSSITAELLRSICERRGLSCEVLPADTRMTELQLPHLDCQEVSTFYSSAAPIANKLFGVPYDWMAPELAEAPDLKPTQQAVLRGLMRIFRAPKARAPA